MNATGTTGDADSQLASVSADGRFIAFWSLASTLVTGDTNGTNDVFVRDRSTGVVERVSVDSRGRQSVGGDRDGVLDTNFGRPVISGDGRFVAFATSATNLVKGDRNDAVDVFLRDRASGSTERVTMASRKIEANGESFRPALSPDGRFVAFGSFADNLVAGDTNVASDVFVRDRQAGTLERVSVTSAQLQADNSSDSPAISADGRFVASASSASNLVPGDVDGISDVFVRDRSAGTTEGVSVNPGVEFGNHSGSPAISADGRFVAFESWESDLVPGDTNNSFDVFVRDRSTGALERVSVDSAGVQGDDWSLSPSISADGRYVAFHSFAGNLVTGDGNFDYDVFVHDRALHTTVRASVTTGGAEGDIGLGSLNPSLSADGLVVAFDSEAVLVTPGTGFPVDVYVHDDRAVAASVAASVAGAEVKPPASACTIVPETFADGNVGTLNTWFFSTTGCETSLKPVRFKVTDGRIPPGTRLFTQGVSSGGITGTPTTEGLFVFTIQVRDATGTTDTESFSIRINPPRPVVITNVSDTLSPGTVGEFYCCGNLFVDGGVPDYTWSLQSGQLPPGLSLSASPGRITGTPTTAGTFTFLVRVTDSLGAFAERTFTIVVS